jgi:hypothetical protein
VTELRTYGRTDGQIDTLRDTGSRPGIYHDIEEGKDKEN